MAAPVSFDFTASQAAMHTRAPCVPARVPCSWPSRLAPLSVWHIAGWQGRTDMCKWLEVQGVGDDINARNEHGHTPLMWAMMYKVRVIDECMQRDGCATATATAIAAATAVVTATSRTIE